MSTSGVDLCVLGPSGRMGDQVARLALSNPRVRLVAAADRVGASIVGNPLLGTDIVVGDNVSAALAAARVYIDFTTPEATAAAALAAREHGTAAVIGTTGLDDASEAALNALAEVAPVFVAPNYSPGVALLLHLAEKAAAALGAEYDLEVVELHHKNKVDSPSGTALALGAALARGRGVDFEEACLTTRSGQVGARTDNEIGIFAVRGGDIVGEHTAFLIGDEERLEITHRAQKRSVFASGALRAAAWVVDKPPGRYSMSDLLGV